MFGRSKLLVVSLALGLSLGAGGSLLAQQPAPPTEKGPAAAGDAQSHIVISVNGDAITAADVQKILKALPAQSREYYSGQGWSLLPQYLVRMKVLLAEARKQKLDQTQEVRDNIQFATESILADAARRQIAQNIAAPDDLVKQMYESKKREYEEVRLRQLLMRTESSFLAQTSTPSHPPLTSEEARKKLEGVRAQALNGADFGDLVRANSDDPSAATSGGDTGFVRYQDVIPPIAQAADALAPGKVSEIIPTPYGLLLIQVVEKRTRPLAEVRPELENSVRQANLEQRLHDLEGQYKITEDEKYFAPKNMQPGQLGAPATATPANR